MDFLTLAIEPTGFWPIIISAFESVVFNYALAIVLLTLVIKIVLLPLDFFNKKVTRDNQRVQGELKPELDKIEKQYSSQPQIKNQKISELYKSHNYNIFGSCIFMLVNLVLTLVIFVSLFSGLNKMANFKMQEQYEILSESYYTAVYEGRTQSEIQTIMEEVYQNNKDSFLWVKNIWICDVPWSTSILPFDSYISSIGNSATIRIYDEATGEYTEYAYSDLTDEQKTTYQTQYEAVMDYTGGEDSNGYLIIPILAVASSIGSQFLMTYVSKRKVKNAQQRALINNPTATVTNQQAQTNKVLLFMLPILMGYITLKYNAVFGLYIVTSQIFSVITMPFIDKLLDKFEIKKIEEKASKTLPSYSRKITSNQSKQSNKTKKK